MKSYLDNSATTALDPRVLKKMLPYLKDRFANASSIHHPGQENNLKLEECRQRMAGIFRLESAGMIFTASASEANNLILRGIMHANRNKGKHLLVSVIEHPSVIQTARALEKEGYECGFISVDGEGRIDLSALSKMIRKDTVLVSVMAVNNEIGTIQDLKKISEIVHAKGVLFHSDIVQAIPYLKLDFSKLGLDAASASAHKFYGPKGAGFAYVKPGIACDPLITGGEQENGRRAGTYNLPGIVGMAEALCFAYASRDKELKQVKDLRDYFWKRLKAEIPDIKLNGGLRHRSPNNLNVRFGRIEGEAILIDLSTKGVCVSTGSACSAHNLKSSSVLKAIGLEDYDLNSNIRFSFGRYNSKKELDYTVGALKKTVKRLREFTPVG
ncbi:MAG: cysteine desulfurase family protein [Bacillota bacterium]